ncbi:hypothetical protein KR018_004849 [Drosophila ironensis]|nr:hypothetical protein KR018_004849 [Drosophila ironensis]
MHSLLVCLSALCFALPGATASALCRDCRVHMIYPWEENANGYRLPISLQTVRIVNEYRRVSLEALQRRNNFEKHAQQLRDFSFLVKIQIGTAVRCSGALIAPQLIISSSVCFENVRPHQLQVLMEGGKTHLVKNIETLEFFPEITTIYLSSPTKVRPAELCEQSPQLGLNASMLMASFDMSFYGRRRTHIVPNAACKKAYEQDKSLFITHRMFCVENSRNPQKCATGPGDALLVDHRLCGLNIYGARCRSNATNADLYTIVSEVKPLLNSFANNRNSFFPS